MTRALRRQPQPTGSATGGARVRQALYADDTVIMAENECGMQRN